MTTKYSFQTTLKNPTPQPYTAPYFVKYNPALVAEFGSQNAVLLFDKLEYWFSKKKNEFYKFIEPCAHPCYRDGDSWCEELGFSRSIFKTAFDKIGTRYRSKTEFLKEKEPFKGKLYAYYQDRKSNKTIFVRNNSLLAELYARLKNLVQKTVKAIKPSPSKPIQNLQPRAETILQPYADANKDKQITTHFKESEIKIEEKKEGEEADASISQNMQDIWREEVGRKGLVTLTPAFTQRMKKAYEDVFQRSLEKWKGHCLKIASSKFLMGEKEGANYEIRLPVALTEKFKDQVEEGRFELATRETNEDKRKKEASQKLKARAVQQEMIENTIENLEREKKDHEKRLIIQREKALSHEERKGYEHKFEILMERSTFSKGAWFREKGWDDFSVKLDFDVFLWGQLKMLLTKKELERPDIEGKINELKKKKEEIIISF